MDDNIRIRIYTKYNIPVDIKTRLHDKSLWVRITRGVIPLEEFGYASIHNAEHIVVATQCTRRGDSIVGLLLGMSSWSITDLHDPPRPVCRKNEFYINLLCTSSRTHGLGTAMFKLYKDYAYKHRKTVIRIYSIDISMGFWRRLGFTQKDDPRDYKQQETVKMYKNCPDMGFRMTCVV